MATWLVFGRVTLGEVEAADKAGAIIKAAREYPNAMAVQSLASYRVAQEEARIRRPMPRLIGERRDGQGSVGR